MSDIRLYTAAQAQSLVPLTGDVILCTESFNSAPANSVHLCTNATGPIWKSFANDEELLVYVYGNHYALDLDGTDDYVDCGGNADFSFTDGSGNDQPFSVSAWVKLDSLTRQRVVAKGDAEWLFGTDGDNKFSFFLWNQDSTSAYLAAGYSGLSEGVWYHMVATYDGSKSFSGINLYLGGSSVNASNMGAGSYTGMSANQGSLRIGQWEKNSSVMNGLVDEVAIFDYELTASEVASLSSADNTQPVDISAISITQPIGWYRMGDDIDRTGTSIKNAANPGTNDGTIVNGTSGNTTPNFVDLNATSESVYVA